MKLQKWQYCFEPKNPITNEKEFTDELFKYADKEKLNLVILEESMRPIVTINGVKYIAVLEVPRMINMNKMYIDRDGF